MATKSTWYEHSMKAMELFVCCHLVFTLTVVSEEVASYRLQASVSLVPPEGIHRYDGDHELESYGTPSGESDWAADDVCKFVAVLGRLFNESLLEKLKQLHPGDDFHNSLVTVKGDFSSSLWLKYNENNFIFLGVPLQSNLDDIVHFMVLVSVNKLIKRTLPCVVDVVSFPVDPILSPFHPVADEGVCLPYEPSVVFVVRLVTHSRRLQPEDRIRLISNLQKYLAPQQLKLITIETDELDYYSAFLSGRGNAAGTTGSSSHIFAVSWVVACGSDAVNESEIESLEKAAENGSLARVTGYDVSEWRLENRKLRSSRSRREVSSKRIFDLTRFKSPVVRVPMATPVPVIDGGYPGIQYDWNFRNAYVEDFDDEVGKRKSFASRITSRERLRNSPAVASPTLPTVVDTLLTSASYKNVANLEERHVPFTSRERHNISNSVLDAIDEVNVHRMTYFQLDLRKSSRNFSDLLTIFNNRSVRNSHHPIKFDPNLQVISGLFTGESSSRKQNVYEYRLRSATKEFQSKSVKFIVLPRPRPVNHRFTVFMKRLGHRPRDNLVASYFANRLVKVLDIEDYYAPLQPPGRFTITKVVDNGRKLTINWFDNRSGSDTWCDKRAVAALWEKLTGHYPKRLVNAYLPPGPGFKKLFRPDFNIKRLKLVLFGPCVVNGIEKISNRLNPPPIAPPFPTHFDYDAYPTTTSYVAASGESVFLNPQGSGMEGPYFTAEVSAKVGKLVVELVNEMSFWGGSPFFPYELNQFFLELEPHFGVLPNWLGVDSNSRSIVALPHKEDIISLPSFNSTHKIWLGKLIVYGEFQRSTKLTRIIVFISQPSDDAGKLFFSPMIILRIINYELQNFTVLDSKKLLNVVVDLYGDTDASHIYVHSLRSGSVVFSWHNTSKSCTKDEQSKQLEVLFTNEMQVKPDVERRFLEAGFAVSSFQWKDPNDCGDSSSSLPPTSTLHPEVHPSVKPKSTYNSHNENSGSNISLVVITLVALFVILILIFIIVKWRRERKQLESRTALQVVAKPHTDHHRSASSVILSKRGAPIIFAEEDDGIVTSSFVHRRKGDTFDRERTFPPNHSVVICDKSPANDGDERPSPPPYTETNAL